LWPSWLWPSWSSFVAVMVCGRHGCGRHGHLLWPSWSSFVAVMVCGRYGCGRHGQFCGRRGLWPSLSNPVSVMSTQLLNIGHSYYLDRCTVPDCRLAGKPSVYVTQPPGSSQPSIPPGYVNGVLACPSIWDAFTCVGWKVTLCDPIWQALR